MPQYRVLGLTEDQEEFVTCLAQGLPPSVAAELADGHSGDALSFLADLDDVIRAYAANLSAAVLFLNGGVWPWPRLAPPVRRTAPALRLIRGGRTD